MNIKRNNILVRTGGGITAFFMLLCFFALAAGGVKENLLTLVLLFLASLTGGFVFFLMETFTRDLNHWYEQILDFVYLPMSVTDMDMNWTFINAPVKNIIGVERGDVMGHHCSGWNADICGTEKCGVAMLRNGLGTSYFTNEGVNMNFKVDTTYLYDRKHPDKKIGHLELVSDVTTKVRLDSAVAAIKESSQTLATTIEQEAATTTELSATAEQFSQNLKSITSNTNNQFSIIEEVVSAIEEMAASVQSVSKNTGNMAERSKENVLESKKGHALVTDSLNGINVVNESLNSIVEQIARLHENTQKVDEILQVINNIASQTNLLSMNAAIEAAHAGEAGKGFSVVAEEIRKLAESSQMSSKEIESILKDVQKGVQETISISTESRDQVQSHLDSFSMSLESFNKIVDNVGAIDRMIDEIDSITEEQSGATGDILGNIKGLMSLSQEIKGAVSEQSMGIEQISSSLVSLSEGTNENVNEAARLKQTANDLDLGE